MTELLADRIVSDPFDMTHPAPYAQDCWQEPFRRHRAEAPVHFVADSYFGPHWSVATYKPIVHIEALPKIFSSSWEYGGITAAFTTGRTPDGQARFPSFIAQDPPIHTAQRRTVAPAFGPGEVAVMKAEVLARTSALLDSLPVGTTFDWVERVSIELTTGMLAKLFDFPWEERHKLTHWSDLAGDIEVVRDPPARKIRDAALFEMGAAFAALGQNRRRTPGKDLISIMLQSDAMAAMSEQEFIGNLSLLIVGGNDTTRNSMSAFAYGLSQFPEARAQLEADPALIPNAVQEIIRWQTPLAHMRRTATEDAEVEGQVIRKGDKVVLWYISANRDESIFEDADRIIVDRANARRHLSFGYGIHRCVGARVAEVQLVVLLEELARRRLRVQAVTPPARVAGCFVHGYKSLPVQLEYY
jgi:cytochrome P450